VRNTPCDLVSKLTRSLFPQHAEFKEIRRQWKARKKEQEARDKAAEEERQRQAAAAAAAAAQNGGSDQQPPADPAQPATTYASSGTVQLPPIGYQPRYPGQSAPGMQQQMPEYNYPNYSPTSPYGQGGQQMYNQRELLSFLWEGYRPGLGLLTVET
jgi:hypothetical protein